MAVVEGNDGFILTKAQSTWLRGGGDRGDHGGASSEMAGAFLQRRASEAKAEQWRAAALSAVRGEMKNGLATWSGRRWLEVEDNGSGVRPASAHGRAIRDPATGGGHAASGLCAGRP